MKHWYKFKIIEEQKLSGHTRYYVRMTIYYWGFFPISYWIEDHGTWHTSISLSWEPRRECWSYNDAEHLIELAKERITVSSKKSTHSMLR